MKKLISILLCLTVSFSYAADPLVGIWSAATAKNGALKGTLDLRTDKSMILHAEGKPAFSGTWEVSKPGILKLTVPEAGSSEMAFSLKASKLSLTYDNGNTQEFRQKKSEAPKVPKK